MHTVTHSFKYINEKTEEKRITANYSYIRLGSDKEKSEVTVETRVDWNIIKVTTWTQGKHQYVKDVADY